MERHRAAAFRDEFPRAARLKPDMQRIPFSLFVTIVAVELDTPSAKEDVHEVSLHEAFCNLKRSASSSFTPSIDALVVKQSGEGSPMRR